VLAKLQGSSFSWALSPRCRSLLLAAASIRLICRALPEKSLLTEHDRAEAWDEPSDPGIFDFRCGSG
jgi:hypothetical protein